MVLYDENYKFLGVSGSLLQKLGYEDISDFSSQHRDFADLFEKENGLIYNFDNFSWIDFIMYGGANKDKAIIKTKNNQKVNVQIDIEEIFLKDGINGVEKLFQVKLDGLEIENLTASEATIPQTNDINLSSFLDNSDEPEAIEKIESKEEPIKPVKSVDEPLSINLSFLKDEDVAINEDTKTTAQIDSLNLLDKEEKINIEPIEKTNTIDVNDEIILNFFKDVNLEETKQETDQDEEPKIELNFLKKDNKVEDIKPIIKKEENDEPTPPTINLGFLNNDKEKSEPEIELNFLKKDDKVEDIKPIIKKEENDEPTPPTINLGFLNKDKKDSEPEIELNFLKKEENDEPTPPTINLGFLNNDKKDSEPEIELNFLKKDDKVEDIKPIIEKDEPTPPTINLDFLNKDKAIEENPKEKSTIINQIKNDIKEIDSNNKLDIKEEENTINNALKSILNINKKTNKIDNIESKEVIPEIKLEKKEEVKKTVNILPNAIHEESSLDNIPLASLDIDDEDKKEIIKDFISEASHNSSLMKEFINNSDFDSINYSIIKINSSAEILSLNNITKNLSQLKIALANKDITQIQVQIKDLDNNLIDLKKYI